MLRLQNKKVASNHFDLKATKVSDIVVSIEFSPLWSAALTNSWYRLHNGDYTVISEYSFVGKQLYLTMLPANVL